MGLARREKMIAVKVTDAEKNAINLITQRTGLPASRILYPVVSAEIEVYMGFVILDELHRVRRGRAGSVLAALVSARGAGQPVGEIPIVHDFLELMRDPREQEAFYGCFQGIRFTPAHSLRFTSDIFDIAREMGRDYIRRFGVAETVNVQNAREIFFTHMLYRLFTSTAQGTVDQLLRAWDASRTSVEVFRKGLVRLYEERYEEALEAHVFPAPEPEEEAEDRLATMPPGRSDGAAEAVASMGVLGASVGEPVRGPSYEAEAAPAAGDRAVRAGRGPGAETGPRQPREVSVRHTEVRPRRAKGLKPKREGGSG